MIFSLYLRKLFLSMEKQAGKKSQTIYTYVFQFAQTQHYQVLAHKQRRNNMGNFYQQHRFPIYQAQRKLSFKRTFSQIHLQS